MLSVQPFRIRTPGENSGNIQQVKSNYQNIAELVLTENPQQPVYCVYPHVYQHTVDEFLGNFAGRVLFAVKANNHPVVLRVLHQAGIRHYDCASIAEIDLVHKHCPGVQIYFMNPVWFRGDARIAQEQYGVRHFVIDHASELAPLLDEIDPLRTVIFARLAVSHDSAAQDLSRKFGAAPGEVPGLLKAISTAGAEPALAFNVGTGVRSPDAYAYALEVVQQLLETLPFRIRLVDIGGGFPRPYPNYAVPEITKFLQRINTAKESLRLAENGELMAEPGRAISAPGLSALTRVLLRKEESIYLNDGMYGIFWELRCKGHREYPFRVFRDGKELNGATKAFQVFGPTCDSDDQLPTALDLPKNIAVGDYIEFGSIGAYSLSGRTDFNGFFSDRVVSFTDKQFLPPQIETT